MPLQPTWRWRALATRFVSALAIVTIASASGIAYAYWFANDLIHRTPKAPIPPGVLTPAKSTDPANYLIVGSDSRAFVHDKVAADHFGTQRTNPENLADVIMIAHVDPKSPGKGFLVSIPRDTWVPITGHGTAKINSAYNYGEVTLIKTIESNFRFKINHYLKLDFATFTDVVNAIGRVHIFFPAAAYDKETGLDIKTPGCRALNGLDALAYARSRTYYYETPTGYKPDRRQLPDIGRIGRQQYFIRTLAEEAIKAGARNPLTARALLEKILPHLEVDRDMGLQEFLGLARAFGTVNPGSVQMVTVPTKSEIIGSTDAQAVIPAQADPIFALLGSFTRSATATLIAPAQIRVQALNGSAVKGVAASATGALRSAGFANGGAAGDADQSDYQYTQVRYMQRNIDKARVVASYLGGVGLLTRVAKTGTADVVVVIGHDFTAVVVPGSHATKSPTSVTSKGPAPVSTATTTPLPNPGSTPGVTLPARAGGKPLVGCG
jgi:LCP family protein required for cell wall assembly